MTDPAVQALCDEFELKIVPANVAPLPGQTRAVQTIGRILRKHGEAHTRLVLACLIETEGNDGLVDEVSLWAVSDLIRACPRWVEEHTSEWLEAFDQIPLGKLMYFVNELRGISHQRHALAGLAYFFLRGILDEHASLAKPVKAQEERGIIPPISRRAA